MVNENFLIPLNAKCVHEITKAVSSRPIDTTLNQSVVHLALLQAWKCMVICNVLILYSNKNGSHDKV